MIIRRNEAEDFMTKKEKVDSQQKQKEVSSEKVELREPTKPIEKLTTKIDNVRKVTGGYLFDMKVEEKDLSLKDIFLPLSSIYTSENLKIRAELRKGREKRKKVIAYFLIYPAAIISLVVILSSLSRLMEYIKMIFDVTGLNF
ncbi:hypothetical protein ACFL0U_02710 [Pseudomonadota bacterium]